MKEFEPFKPKGGVMDGQPLSADQVQGGQQMAQPPGAAQHPVRPDPQPGCEACRRQLLGAGAKLASQIKKKSEEGE